jgi:hypothetical protein
MTTRTNLGRYDAQDQTGYANGDIDSTQADYDYDYDYDIQGSR